jgi:hypothetical protein
MDRRSCFQQQVLESGMQVTPIREKTPKRQQGASDQKLLAHLL